MSAPAFRSAFGPRFAIPPLTIVTVGSPSPLGLPAVLAVPDTQSIWGSWPWIVVAVIQTTHRGHTLMHVRQSIELAALISSSAQTIVNHSGQLSQVGIEEYWTVSKCRHESWSRKLKQHSTRIKSLRGRPARQLWCGTRGVLEEILTSEILTRVWAAVCCANEQRRGTVEAAPIVRNVLTGHLEARHRALNLMVQGHGLHVEEAVNLNRLRRRTERWTDVLLGNLVPNGAVDEFAFSAERVRDFADHSDGHAIRSTRYQWLLASLRASYQRGLAPVSPNAELNGRIAAAILSCLGPELFDSTGLLKSHWLARLDHTTNDTQGMIEQLLVLDEPGGRSPDGFPTRARYPRRGDLLDT